MTQEDRWRQRFESFSRALALLREALSLPESDLSDLEREGLVQRFHYTYECAWRVIKDRLDHEGIVLENATPRRVVREAFAAGLLKDGETWMDMIGDRNLTAHTYDPRGSRQWLPRFDHTTSAPSRHSTGRWAPRSPHRDYARSSSGHRRDRLSRIISAYAELSEVHLSTAHALPVGRLRARTSTLPRGASSVITALRVSRLDLDEIYLLRVHVTASTPTGDAYSVGTFLRPATSRTTGPRSTARLLARKRRDSARIIARMPRI